jgi:hypothetical protein
VTAKLAFANAIVIAQRLGETVRGDRARHTADGADDPRRAPQLVERTKRRFAADDWRDGASW